VPTISPKFPQEMLSPTSAAQKPHAPARNLASSLPSSSISTTANSAPSPNPSPKTHAAAYNVEKLIDQLHPQVVLTWGSEGGYGHPDHRLVSAAVTQVVQSLHSSVKLYYAGLSPVQAKPLNSVWPASLPFHTTDPAYLTVTVSYTPKDFETFKRLRVPQIPIHSQSL
jgi:hypothetical protein